MHSVEVRWLCGLLAPIYNTKNYKIVSLCIVKISKRSSSAVHYQNLKRLCNPAANLLKYPQFMTKMEPKMTMATNFDPKFYSYASVYGVLHIHSDGWER